MSSTILSRATSFFTIIHQFLLIGLILFLAIGAASYNGLVVVTQTLNPAYIGHDGGSGWVYYNFSERSDIADPVQSHQDRWTRSGLFFSEGDYNAGTAHGALHAAAILLEDGKPLGPPHAFNDVIQGIGAGAYSFRTIGLDRALAFSTSDNSDPRTNGRKYSISYPIKMTQGIFYHGLYLFLFLLGLKLILWYQIPRKLFTCAKKLLNYLFIERKIESLVCLVSAISLVIVFSILIVLSELIFKIIDLSGILLLFYLAIATVVGLFSVRQVVRTIMLVGWHVRVAGGATANAALVAASIFMTMIMLEGFLHLNETLGVDLFSFDKVAVPETSQTVGGSTADSAIITLSPEAAARKASRAHILSMPESWARRATTLPGAVHAYYWHEALEVYDDHNFRRIGPFPPKQPDTFRVMVVGDSLTYGEGIEERFGYTALLNSALGKRYKIEFLNLGQDGNQSEDVLHLIQEFLPKLKPDMVFYGICLNDFLPSGVGEYSAMQKYAFPIPKQAKKFFLNRLRSAKVLDWAYDAALRRIGLRRDFFDDILSGFSGYQVRFQHDVAEMNAVVTRAGIGPMMAMVLDQYPNINGRGYTLAKIAEDLVRRGGGDVIPTEPFYRTYNNRAFNVSPWEGHPDEEANAIWADMIAHALLSHRSELAQYRIGTP